MKYSCVRLYCVIHEKFFAIEPTQRGWRTSKYEADKQARTSVSDTSQYIRCGTIWTATWFFQNIISGSTYSAATISGYGRYRPNYAKREKVKFGNFNRANKKDFNIIVD